MTINVPFLPLPGGRGGGGAKGDNVTFFLAFFLEQGFSKDQFLLHKFLRSSPDSFQPFTLGKLSCEMSNFQMR